MPKLEQAWQMAFMLYSSKWFQFYKDDFLYMQCSDGMLVLWFLRKYKDSLAWLEGENQESHGLMQLSLS